MLIFSPIKAMQTRKRKVNGDALVRTIRTLRRNPKHHIMRVTIEPMPHSEHPQDTFMLTIIHDLPAPNEWVKKHAAKFKAAQVYDGPPAEVNASAVMATYRKRDREIPG